MLPPTLKIWVPPALPVVFEVKEAPALIVTSFVTLKVRVLEDSNINEPEVPPPTVRDFAFASALIVTEKPFPITTSSLFVGIKPPDQIEILVQLPLATQVLVAA